MVQKLFDSGVVFGRNMVGIITRPYETYRRIVAQGTLWELAYIGFLLVLYFATAAIVKTSLFRPFLLTRQFILLGTAAGVTFLFTVSLFWQVGRLFGAKGNLQGLLLGWGYSLVPTAVWFWMTSLLYVIVPPPRTTSALGIVFSIVFLLTSATLFFWKIILSYLTLRFGLRLDMLRIVAVSVVVLPILAAYSFGMYRLGIFRIPFI